MKKLNELTKKFNNLNINRLKMCGYLVDNEIDKAVESDDFNFISNTLIDYFEGKDTGYLLTKFKDSGLEEKVDDVDFVAEDWYKIQEEIKKEEAKIRKILPDMHIKNKDEYVNEMIKKRKS